MRFLSHENIAAIIGCSHETLRKHYPGELERGTAKAGFGVTDGLHKLAQKGNVAALIFLAKAKLGWSEKQVLEHQGAGGGPVRHYLSMPEPVRKAELRALAARVLEPPEGAAADGFEQG